MARLCAAVLMCTLMLPRLNHQAMQVQCSSSRSPQRVLLVLLPLSAVAWQALAACRRGEPCTLVLLVNTVT
jgi:hypothetical protein